MADFLLDFSDFYTTEHISKRMDGIRSKTGEIMYLIKGDHSAVLIDTCLGVGDLPKVIRSLTDLPVTVLLSHGHVDHAMGAGWFDEVYMNEADKNLFHIHSTRETRQGYTEANLGLAPGSLKDAEFIPAADPDTFHTLKEGDVFDLGGITIESYALPGHTAGTMVFLIPEEKVLITGDAANNALFLFDDFSLTVTEYKNSLQILKEKIFGRYDKCYMMHHDMKASGELLEHMEDVCNDIISGNTDDLPFEFMGGSYFIAKNIEAGFKRCDGREGNIVYNKNKI